MPQGQRIVIPGLPHHAYLRGNNRRRLFSSKGDRLAMLRCLRRGLDAGECLLHQLTLMTNHLHLIVTPPRADGLAVLFKRANQRYAQLRNEQRGDSGKLFEQRYRSKPITSDAQLMATTLYNDANAYRAGMVADPLAHAWSSGPLHAQRAGALISTDMWTPSAWYLGLGTTPAERGAAYAELMSSYVKLEHEALVDDDVERADSEAYSRRVERPDGSSAREAALQWGKKAK